MTTNTKQRSKKKQTAPKKKAKKQTAKERCCEAFGDLKLF
jgi:hypothetical protein